MWASSTSFQIYIIDSIAGFSVLLQPKNLQRGHPLISNCPRCQSTRIATRHIGRKTCGAFGTAAGAAAGLSTAASGARLGLTVGFIAGPAGPTLGGVAGAIVGGLVGGFAGGSAGAAVGEMLDETVFDNFECLECGFRFSVEPE